MTGSPVHSCSRRSLPAHGLRLSYPFAALLAGFIFAGTIALAPPSKPDAVVAVLFSPYDKFDRQMEILAVADGRFYGSGGFTNVLFARSGAPGFITRLKRAGAWAVFDPIFFLGDARAMVPTIP